MVGKQLIENVIKQIGTKLKSDYVHKETNKGLSTNDLTDNLVEKINNTNNYDDTELRNIISTKANTIDTYNKTSINNLLFNKIDKEENKSLISNSDLEQININKNNILLRALITETCSQIQLTIDNQYRLGAILKDNNGNTIYVSNLINLPLENMVVNATYDNSTREIVLILENGNLVKFSVADLINGLITNTQLNTILTNYYSKTEADNLLITKVDKVAGKQLSSNDFTNAYMTKLEGLENYDDTQINNKIPDMTQQEIDNLISEYFREV